MNFRYGRTLSYQNDESLSFAACYPPGLSRAWSLFYLPGFLQKTIPMHRRWRLIWLGFVISRTAFLTLTLTRCSFFVVISTFSTDLFGFRSEQLPGSRILRTVVRTGSHSNAAAAVCEQRTPKNLHERKFENDVVHVLQSLPKQRIKTFIRLTHSQTSCLSSLIITAKLETTTCIAKSAILFFNRADFKRCVKRDTAARYEDPSEN